MRDKDKDGSPWKKFTVEPQASLMKPLPLPMGGVLVIGYETISYYNKGIQRAIDPPVVKVCCHGYL